MSITGVVLELVQTPAEDYCVLAAYVAKIGGGYPISAAFPVKELGLRLGTPISQIATQPGQLGYAEWLRISQSWTTL
jgi:hypothetical protein